MRQKQPLGLEYFSSLYAQHALHCDELNLVTGGDFPDIDTLMSTIFPNGPTNPMTGVEYGLFKDAIIQINQTPIGHFMLSQLYDNGQPITLHTALGGDAASFSISDNTFNARDLNHMPNYASVFKVVAHELFHAFQHYYIYTNPSDPYWGSVNKEIDAELFVTMAIIEFDKETGSHYAWDIYDANNYLAEFSFGTPSVPNPQSYTVYLAFLAAWNAILIDHEFSAENYNLLIDNFKGGTTYNRGSFSGSNLSTTQHVTDTQLQSNPNDIYTLFATLFANLPYPNTNPFDQPDPNPPGAFDDTGVVVPVPGTSSYYGSYYDGGESSMDNPGVSFDASYEEPSFGNESYGGGYDWHDPIHPEGWDEGGYSIHRYINTSDTENSISPLTNEKLLTILNHFFPDAAGFLLTGSQRTNSPFYINADIDVIVVDPIVSDVLAYIKVIEGYRIDATIIPLANIDNILLNESSDPKGVLITMLENSVILDDKLSILTKIQDKAADISKTLAIKNYLHYRTLLNKLTSYKKYFVEDVPETKRLFLLCDLVSLVTAIETVKMTNWASDRSFKATILYSKDSAFSNDLENVFKKGLDDSEFTKVADYIDFYCSETNMVNSPIVPSTTRIVLDVRYDNISINAFVNDLEAKIKDDPALKDRYKYFSRSPLKFHRIYKNKLSIVIKPTEASYLYDDIKDYVQFFRNNTKNFKYNLVYQYNTEWSTDYFAHLEKIRQATSEIVDDLLNENPDYPSSILQGHAIVIINYFVKLLDIDKKDTMDASQLIATRWMFSGNEIRKYKKFGNDRFFAIRKKRVDSITQYYSKNKSAILDYCEKGMSYAGSTPVDPIYSSLFTEIQSIKLFDPEKIGDSISESVLNKMDFKNPERIRKYETVIEQVFQYLNLSDFEKIRCLLVASLGKSDIES